jgi:hypothetical protein
LGGIEGGRKIDSDGQITEDLRAQILGQLGSRLRYDKLYQEAVRDPSLKRTRQEIEVAMSNALLAREVVFELFQDLDTFNLSDFQEFDDQGRGMQRLLTFAQRAAHLEGSELRPDGEEIYELIRPSQPTLLFTTERNKALAVEELNLLGLEHPMIKAWMEQATSLPPEERGVIGQLAGNGQGAGLVTIWHVTIHAPGGQIQQQIVRLGLTPTGERSGHLERLSQNLLKTEVASGTSTINRENLSELVSRTAAELLHRQLTYSGALQEGASYSSRLLACLEVQR